MKGAVISSLFCLLVLHSPDGSPLLVFSNSVRVVRPVAHEHGLRSHVAKNTNSVVYSGGQNFGVSETAVMILQKLRACEQQSMKEN